MCHLVSRAFACSAVQIKLAPLPRPTVSFRQEYGAFPSFRPNFVSLAMRVWDLLGPIAIPLGAPEGEERAFHSMQ